MHCLTIINLLFVSKNNHCSPLPAPFFLQESSIRCLPPWKVHPERQPILQLGCSRRRRNSPGIHLNSAGDELTRNTLVVNFYRFVCIENPEEEVLKHRSFLEGRDIRGRIYLNEQGINAQYSGPSEDALAYLEWLRNDQRFSDILAQISPASAGHAFPRLNLRYKPSLVQMEGGISHLPLLDPEKRALPLIPTEWKERLRNLSGSKSSTESDRNFLLLDVRNGYEWDVGHFEGACRPNVDCFRSTSFGLSEAEFDATDPLANVEENTDIMMYCTGGIRCDVYSTILRWYKYYREKGFNNLYTLKGGVSHFLAEEGPGEEWVGNLFVFDGRLSLPPSAFTSDYDKSKERNNGSLTCTSATCHLCGSLISELRHRNCANLDCNLLFLCCMKCVEEFQGCCSLTCISAPRIRPVLPGHQRYQKWHSYRDAGTADVQPRLK